ncbi:MAG: hypothetical protein ACE14P_06510 [Methanotrichaceae archaeon]
MATKGEVMCRIRKIDEICTMLNDIRRSEITELERLEDLEGTGKA